MAAFALLRQNSAFASSYFDPLVEMSNAFRDPEVTHWENFCHTATYHLFNQLPKMITDDEIAAKRAEKERNWLSHLMQSSYVAIPKPDCLDIDVYRIWQTKFETGACNRAFVVMLRENVNALSKAVVIRAFMDCYYDCNDFYDNVFQLNYDVRHGIFGELKLIKNEMFNLRINLEAFFDFIFKSISNYLKVVDKYMECGLKSHFFEAYFSYQGVYNRKTLKFKEYMTVTLQMLMSRLMADMETVDDLWPLIVAKIFYDDLMPLEEGKKSLNVEKKLLTEIKEVQLVFSLYGVNDDTISALNVFVNEKFGWHAYFMSSLVQIYPF